MVKIEGRGTKLELWKRRRFTQQNTFNKGSRHKQEHESVNSGRLGTLKFDH
jgi:DNA-binding transcriptional regulator/RsmH inhibitor MraZ